MRGSIAASVAVAGGLAKVASIASASYGSKGGSSGGYGSSPSGTGSSVITTPAAPATVQSDPVAPAPVTNIYLNGQLTSMDQVVNEWLIPATTDAMNNADVVLFNGQSAQAQVING